MADRQAIQLFSDMLNDTHLGSGDSMMLVEQCIEKYPYFLPARYIKACRQHKSAPDPDVALAGIYPYKGNWLLLLGHLEGRQETRVSSGDFAAVAMEAPAVVELPETREEIEGNIAIAQDAEIREEFMAEAELVANEPADAPEIEIMSAIVHEPLPMGLVEADAEDEAPVEEIQAPAETVTKKEEDIFLPLYSEDYFMQQGIKIPGEMPVNVDSLKTGPDDKKTVDKKDKSLMVMMSFTEWLLHFKHSSEKEIAEKEGQKAVRTMWQKEKLAAALEEEDEEIPENVFEMAVNSITREDGLASESLADIYTKQGKYDQAIEMYRKLSLRNPQKNTYFAQKIEAILKDKQI